MSPSAVSAHTCPPRSEAACAPPHGSGIPTDHDGHRRTHPLTVEHARRRLRATVAARGRETLDRNTNGKVPVMSWSTSSSGDPS
jgi:hypothetical protein